MNTKIPNVPLTLHWENYLFNSYLYFFLFSQWLLCVPINFRGWTQYLLGMYKRSIDKPFHAQNSLFHVWMKMCFGCLGIHIWNFMQDWLGEVKKYNKIKAEEFPWWWHVQIWAVALAERKGEGWEGAGKVTGRHTGKEVRGGMYITLALWFTPSDDFVIPLDFISTQTQNNQNVPSFVSAEL